MSRTVAVRFGGRWFWAYDVSLGVLLLEAVHVGLEMPPERLPRRAADVLEDLRVHARLLATIGFALDQKGWDTRERDFVQTLVAEAGRRFRERGVITAADASRRYLIDGEPFFLRGASQVDGAVVADLADAILRLVRGELPPTPEPDRRWYLGLMDGPRQL
ncbi:hypothetical protein [Plantactinospora sp. GCM10030261]|uniref:hypothetical protein n=1 Tax=Plantactinospora sp. GCM10030261 TaxID=3273420 RepID=UPI0036147DE6